MLIKTFVSLKLAKLLKEKGFDELCVGYYDPSKVDPDWVVPLTTTSMPKDNADLKECQISAPTHQHVIAWLTERQNIDISVLPTCDILGHKAYFPEINVYKPKPRPELLDETDEWNDRWVKREVYLRCDNDNNVISAIKSFPTREESYEAAIEYVLTRLVK